MQNDVDIAYFEIQLLRYEPGAKLSVGLVTDAFVLDDLPGSQAKSVGYHANGEFWMNGRRKGPELPKWTSKSFVGCGLNYVTSQLFFTLDGLVVKTEENFSGKWFPCVGLHGPGQRIRANFGRSRFHYDIRGKRKQLLSQQRSQIDEIRDTSFTRIVYNYLLFHAYQETANALAAAKLEDLEPLTERDSLMLSTLELRSQIRSLLHSGRLDDAKHLLIAHFGDLAVTSEAMFVLDCQTFIEAIRNKRTLEAIEFSQSCFLRWWGEATYERIEACCSLLAYFTPTQAPAAYLLSQAHLDSCFELVNRSILEWTGVFQPAAPALLPLHSSSAEHPSPSSNLILTDEPDITSLFAHLANTHALIRKHRGAGVPFSLDLYTVTEPSVSASPNPLKTPLTPATAVAKRTF
jgi:hypothetical protein